MEDIGKELCGRVKKALEERVRSNAFMMRLREEISEGRASMKDASLYSQALGIDLRRAIREVVTPAELPDSTLYYNIAHSILEPMLRDTYEDVNSICADIQSRLDGKAGIHLAPQKADFPAERVRAAAGSASTRDTAEHGIEVLERTSENITAAFSDDYMKANADFRSRAGLDTYIERRDDGKCCEWCSKIAGRYSYPDKAPKDIFRRHDNCGCTVEYVSSRGRQNVWSKRWASEPKKIEYSKPTVLTKEQARELEKRLTEEQKRDIINTRGIAPRGLPNGLRTSPSHILTEAEIESLKNDIASIGADESVFKFNKGRRTGYDDVLDEIRVRGDILPDLNSKHPRDRMSSRAALAHEYYGHRVNRGTNLPNGAWNDEFRASYMAARDCPNLSDEERADLILDALERAKESGVAIKYNDFIRRILYGY